MADFAAERAVGVSGATDALVSVLRTIAEATGTDGPRYGPATMRSLARMIAAHAYGKPLLELCHLLRAADAAGGRHG